MPRASIRLAPAAVFLAASAALAQPKDKNSWDGGYELKATRRSDVTIGFAPGLLFGNATGYPNEVEKIGDPAYKSTTGFTTGAGASLWIGAALRDWLTFSLGTGGGNLQKGNTKATVGGFLARVEAFPLFAEGGAWQDVGLSAAFGLGVVTLEEHGEKKAEGGAMALTRFGAFYEAWHFGKFALGPNLEYVHMFSQTLTLDSGMAGVRLVFYGGPS